MKKNKLAWLIAYLGLILLCVVVIYVIPSVRGMLVSTYLAEQGEINLTNEVEAYVIRNEKVYVAKNATTVKRIAEEGQLYKAGSRIVEMSGEGLPANGDTYTQILSKLGKRIEKTSSGNTKYAGYIVYKVDGAESKFRKAKMKKLKHEVLDEYASLGLKNTVKGQCAAGEPVFKVIKNGKYHLVFYVDNDSAKRYYEGQTVSVNLNGKDVDADVSFIKKVGEETKIILKCGMLYDGYLTDRKVDAVITTSGAKGLVIKDKSIVKKDKKQGVLVKNKLGDYIFKPICIKADDGENCVVYQDIYMDEKSNFVETISIYDEIVENPSEKDVADAE